MERNAPEHDPELYALHPMSTGEWLERHFVGEGLKGLPHPLSTPADIGQELGLGEHAIGEGERGVVEWFGRFPRPESTREVVIEAGQGVIGQEPRS